VKFLKRWIWMITGPGAWISECLGCSQGEGREGAKVFLALGICLAAVFLVFYIVVKGKEKE
jgi:hypothetical protein